VTVRGLNEHIADDLDGDVRNAPFPDFPRLKVLILAAKPNESVR